MSEDDRRLQDIQRLQFTDKPQAEASLLVFIQETFPDLAAQAVTLRPLAVSLNSFNGFLHLASGKQLFFKTHIEPNSIIGEYYNAALLNEIGYPVVQPLYSSTAYGKQFLIYEVIDSPSVFDVCRDIETAEKTDAIYARALSERLCLAQERADDDLFDLYERSLTWQSAEEAEAAPIHQLFYHRLVGGRYDQFYLAPESPFLLPKVALPWRQILQRHWRINDVLYQGTLEEAIENARHLLNPKRAGWSVAGHGDAHNGNVFLTEKGLLYFDPAFGGRHHPLLDLTKPLFHNVRATWMYHPTEVAAALQIAWEDDGHTIYVHHDYAPAPIAVRQMFEQSKSIRVLAPILHLLANKNRDEGISDYQAFLRAALLCCPLLTMNLADRGKFPPEIGLLGVSMCVQVGLVASTS
jgi:hypothetical protein